MTEPRATIYAAAAIRDADGRAHRPGAVAVRDGRILAAGDPKEVRETCNLDPSHDCGSALLLPALVNAHAHLDLTGIGPRPCPSDFITWVESVMRDRPASPAGIRDAVTNGLRASRDAGTGWLGDVAGSEDAVRARIDAPPPRLPGTSWLECFGLGARAGEAAAEAERRLRALRALPGPDDVRIALQPHAPYSAGPALYEKAAELGAPTTHLAETLAEDDFVRSAVGPFADLLRHLGKWDPTLVPTGKSPVAALAGILARGPWLLAHCNYLDDHDLALLARAGRVSIAYCPVASEYFGHRDHRYRELLAAGVDVCLGTDSILCQPPDEAQPLGILPQMRRLWHRDRAPAELLLEMATVRGARALLLPPGTATLAPGAPARLASVDFDPDDPTDPLEQVLANSEPLTRVGHDLPGLC